MGMKPVQLRGYQFECLPIVVPRWLKSQAYIGGVEPGGSAMWSELANWSARTAAASLTVFGVVLPVHAQDVGAEIQLVARHWVADAAQTAGALVGGHLRMEVSLGGLDPRLKLAPCGNMEPYLPPGTKLWGKTRIAVRCIDGISKWNVSLPVTVSGWGRAWVVRNPIATGAALGLNDVV